MGRVPARAGVRKRNRVGRFRTVARAYRNYATRDHIDHCRVHTAAMVGYDWGALQDLIAVLVVRREQVRGLIEDFRKSSPDPFPTWENRDALSPGPGPRDREWTRLLTIHPPTAVDSLEDRDTTIDADRRQVSGTAGSSSAGRRRSRPRSISALSHIHCLFTVWFGGGIDNP